MIALLTGRIAYKSPDHIILDVQGVGYRVHIPFSTYYELPEEGGTATLHIHTSVREDAILLYGFRTRLEKTFFQLLIAVSGVGPKLARDILSNIHPGPLAQALAQGDLNKLSTIPGIGKKTAERLVLELKDKVCILAGQRLDQAPIALRKTGVLNRNLCLMLCGQPTAQSRVTSTRTARNIRRRLPSGKNYRFPSRI